MIKKYSTCAEFTHGIYRFKIMHDKVSDEYLYLRFEYRHNIHGGIRPGYWQKVIEDRYRCYEEASERMAMQIYTMMHHPNINKYPTL